MGLISNPSSKHYLSKDVFTYVSSIPNNSASDTARVFKKIEMAVGDTVFIERAGIFLSKITPNPTHPLYIPSPDQIAASAQITAFSGKRKFSAEPIYYIKGNIENSIPAEVSELGLDIRFTKILPEEGKVRLEINQEIPPQQFVIMKATIFPWINILWMGSFIAGIGFFMSMFQRRKEAKRYLQKMKS